MSRIQTIYGSKPILIVAPHGGGPTDIRSAYISEIIAAETKGFAVINTGWERSDKANYRTFKADCNNIEHCSKQPLLSEFLAPLDYCKNIILSNHNKVYIFLIHGMDDTIRNYNKLNVVVGYGEGNPPRHTCSQSFKHRFISCLDLEGFVPAQGKSGGRLSGWNKDNLNQMYIKDKDVESVQVEIALSLRENNSLARKTAISMGEAIARTCDKTRSVPLLTLIPSY